MNEQEQGGGVRSLNQVVQIDDGRIAAHLDEVVRSTVEETLNALLDAEADRLCGAQRYERNEARQDTRAGSYQRQLQALVKYVVSEHAHDSLSKRDWKIALN